MSVNGVQTSSKSYDAGVNGLPAVQKQPQQAAPAADAENNTARQVNDEEKNSKTSEARLAGDAMRARLDGEMDSAKAGEAKTQLLASTDATNPKKLANSSEANKKLQEIAASDPLAYQAITGSIPKMNDNKKQALIQVIMSPDATPQSIKLAAESLAGLPEKAHVQSNGKKYTGISFGGDQSSQDHLKKLKDEGKLGQGEFDVLMSISKNEGQMNAVNTYDGEVVSFGLRQNSASGALQPLLKSVRDQNPEKFKEHFEDKGISLKEESGRTLLLYKSPSSGKEFKLPDEKKKIPLEDRLHLANVFHAASKDPQVSDILNTAQVRSARNSLNQALGTAVAGGSVAQYVTSNRGKATINDWYNHLPANAKEDFKKSMLDVYSKHGFDTSDPKKLNRDQLTSKVAEELYQKDHPGAHIPAERMADYKKMATQQIEEEFIQKTKQLRMEYFKEKDPGRVGEIENRYKRVDQYFLSKKNSADA